MGPRRRPGRRRGGGRCGETGIRWSLRGSGDAIPEPPDLGTWGEFPRQKFGSWWRPGVALELLRWLRAIPGGGYDLVVDCQGLARSGFFSWWTGSRRRVGYADAAEMGWVW